MSNYVLTVATFLLINVCLASSFNLVLGYAGLFSAAQAAIYGVGAYVSALAMLKLGSPFPVALVISVLVTGGLGVLVGRLTIRLGGHYLVIGTLALQFLFIDLVSNADDVTGGRVGLPAIPRASLGDFTFDSAPMYLLLTAIVAAVLLGIVAVLVRSPWGLLLRALREDEIGATSLGKDVTTAKTVALGIGSALTAVSGSLYAHYVQYLDPTGFDVPVFIAILAMVIVGGSATFAGPILGAALLTVVPEVARYLGLTGINQGPIQQIIFAGVLLVFVIFRPGGIVAESRPVAVHGG
jgi:ABC-type branched-subunit amino acid transport system permease subunit